MLRTIGAVLAGFVAMAVLVMAGTVALTATLMPGGLAGMHSQRPGAAAPPVYLGANLVLSFLAALFGGWLTVTIAGSAPLIHAGALAAFVLVMGIVSARQAGGAGNHPGQPLWYPWVITGLGVAGVLAGGLLRTGS